MGNGLIVEGPVAGCRILSIRAVLESFFSSSFFFRSAGDGGRAIGNSRWLDDQTHFSSPLASSEPTRCLERDLK